MKSLGGSWVKSLCSLQSQHVSEICFLPLSPYELGCLDALSVSLVLFTEPSLHNQDLSMETCAEMRLDRIHQMERETLQGPSVQHLPTPSREWNPFWNEGLRICCVARETGECLSGLLAPGRQGVGDWSMPLDSMTHCGEKKF